MLKVLLNGAAGRMGQALLQVAKACDVEIVGQIDQGDDPADSIEACDVAVDFSFHRVTLPLCRLAADHGKAVVIGTTGHTPQERKDIQALTTRIPIIWSGNYSVGVNLLFYLTRKAAGILGGQYEPEITEIHHRHKKDAPSGTAAALADIIREVRHLDGSVLRFGRSGMTGERDAAELGIHSLRGGEVVGEHTVYFIGPHDRIELTHRAANREILAEGALRAAHWVARQAPGLYDMEDVLGLREENPHDRSN